MKTLRRLTNAALVLLVFATALFAIAPGANAIDLDNTTGETDRRGGIDGPVIGPEPGDCPVPLGDTRQVQPNWGAPQLPFGAGVPANFTPLTSDYSGIALDEANGEVWIVDNKPDLVHVYATNGTLKRTLDASSFAGDLEGIALMKPGRFALLDENDGEIHVVEESGGALSVLYSIETCMTELAGGDGLEGIAYIPPRRWQNFETFVVAWEGQDSGQPALHRFRRMSDGTVHATGSLDLSAVVGDAAGVHRLPGGTFYVLSEDSRRIIEIDSFANGEIIGQLSVAQLSQPEGLAVNAAGTQLWVTGEPNQVMIFF